jgi:hypothetical protein
MGLLVRVITAYFAFGPMAVDDWAHGLMPAHRLFEGQDPLVPYYRSYLLVWVLSGFFHLGSWLGIQENRIHQIQWVTSCLGVLSLLGVLGTYVYVKDNSHKVFSALAIYLSSLYFAMPFLGTRAFGESIAATCLILGLALCETLGRKNLFALGSGLLLMGLATLFRYQVGLVFVTYGVILCFRKEIKPLMIYGFSGIGILLMEITVDLMSGRGPLQTLQSYFLVNQGGAVSMGVQPWYTHILLLSVLTLFPVSLLFWDQVKSLFKNHTVLCLSFIVFVSIHSIIPHKEERFMFPIIPFLLIALAFVWSQKKDSLWVNRCYFPLMLILNTVGLLFIMSLNPLDNLIKPLRHLQSETDFASVIDLSDISNTFLKDFVIWKDIHFISRESINTELLAHTLLILASQSEPTDVIRTFRLTNIQNETCSQKYDAGSWLDALLYKLNPRIHHRRQPTNYIICNFL